MVTFTLTKPVEHNGQTYDVLNFREATAGDMMTAEKMDGPLAQTAAVLACMADIPLPVFRKISARDFNRIMAATAELMGNDPAGTTGE
ncbi:phage tail assembly protein [Rhizobium flavescens]|uniref:phage tail assembly protein n=1 Tax=Rhizobium flavescens TaxID=2607407 RepID=UPI001409EBBA|nr:phage tail assembly protein [Rhizobium flavescens]